MFTEIFMIKALIAGSIVASISGPLGCFVVWRRMAYFSDSLAHSSLLGFALGLVWGIGVDIGIIITCSIFSLFLVWLQERQIFADDTLLGLLSHSALSLGMVTIALVGQVNVDIYSYLFGDILSVTQSDIYLILGGSIIVLCLLSLFWRHMLLMTIHKDLAKAEGVDISWVRLLLMMLITIIVALSIKIVGLLLITSLLIIPAACARVISKTPEQMALLASCAGVVAVFMGLCSSYQWDSPAGPSIVLSATVLFILTLTFSRIFKV